MTQQSNQTAGTDAKSCPWCDLWNAAFAASRIDHRGFPDLPLFHWQFWVRQLQEDAKYLLEFLVVRETDCPGCQRSAEIQ